jgi:hypothetical protein
MQRFQKTKLKLLVKATSQSIKFPAKRKVHLNLYDRTLCQFDGEVTISILS